MNAFVVIIPLLLIRYGLPLFYDKSALVRASHYPTFPREREIFLVIYQLCTCLLLIIPFFLKISSYSIIGISIYTLGIIILIVSTIHFSKPNSQNLNSNGIYRLSRNPMYVGYFIYFLGCVFMTESILLFIVLMLFQISCHWLILEEEKWCINKFGNQYIEYMKKVRRYF
ncbi:MAG: isoprenylcysteine carboxylmethyltransferase family protein [Coprobacillus sp.]